MDQTPAPQPPLPASVGVLVIGAGLAGLCAAIEAARAGASVLVLDAAPPARLGGNARHGRNIRVASDIETPFQRDSYPAEEFERDLLRVGAGDPDLARVLAEGSRDLADWLLAQGVRLEPWAAGNLPYSRRTVFLRGGGQALTNALLSRARRLGVEIRAGIAVDRLPPEAFDPAHDGPLTVTVGTHRITTQALVLASGGLGANRDWLAKTHGPRADHIANRGTPEQLGGLLLQALAEGAQAAGLPGDGHVVAVDPRAPFHDAGIVSRVDGMQHGIVVGADGRRFADEGAIRGPERHSVWARQLLSRPDPRAWILLGADAAKTLPPMACPPLSADTPEALAGLCGIDPGGLAETLNRPPDPPRTGEIMPLVVPLHAIPMIPGIGFTRYGLVVDAFARVRLNDAVAPRLFAAGTNMCGAILGQGYLSGAGLTIAAVFGRIAGRAAARLAPKVRSLSQPLPSRPVVIDPVPDPFAEAKRALNLCNSCGFCTGLCAVFPAAQGRPDLTRGDLRHLAHLCHDCRSCLHDCQYAAPHAFGINLPATLAELRRAEYREPLRPAQALFALCCVLPPLLLLTLQPLERVFASHTGPGAFYALIPHPVMAGATGAVMGLAALGLALRLALFWRAGRGPVPVDAPALRAGIVDALTLRNLADCEDRAGPAGRLRRIAHHLLAGGFGLTFLATVAGFVLHKLGQPAPYPLLSAPVILGTSGGVAMLAGLALMSLRPDPLKTPAMARSDRFLRGQLALLAGTGLALLALRDTPAMGLLLALHLGAVAGAVLGLPFSKLSHGGWRLISLIRAAAEARARQRDRARLDRARSKTASGPDRAGGER
ncbi:precorrin-3B synthase CobZ [Rhodobacter capsulatus]|uniref:precorrin-3B synthase CobZ n=1 Tax=Rhodobacter capsulatus TaxID=1061 RepID=UPI0003D2D292|nr:precorrin-3B synthase CobZ [Rhodobacter capsulatus]ETD01777.1 tricarballylate dehydrogenase [Rhodobacter capsulatus DE442]ETD76845.1 tricarballylate dehydrogenase [Rhodobacter capsulatus R121]ETE53682.1 tricarballylate dehydrogenase [Rhodobacter capsulatus Y262]MDS0927509.1 precorrin-3B synthase CobZ [Rhodobacter capsulatus]TQD33729.1 precorrin-3B synthase CobZ [Rhodobacter capsulatus]